MIFYSSSRKLANQKAASMSDMPTIGQQELDHLN